MNTRLLHRVSSRTPYILPPFGGRILHALGVPRRYHWYHFGLLDRSDLVVPREPRLHEDAVGNVEDVPTRILTGDKERSHPATRHASPTCEWTVHAYLRTIILWAPDPVVGLAIPTDTLHPVHRRVQHARTSPAHALVSQSRIDQLIPRDMTVARSMTPSRDMPHLDTTPNRMYTPITTLTMNVTRCACSIACLDESWYFCDASTCPSPDPFDPGSPVSTFSESPRNERE